VKILKRISIVLALSLALCLAFVGSAYANFGPHGGYIDDTDSCAGCHRAHTSFSTVGWTDTLGTQHDSALLVGSAATMTEFCNACHGDNAPGASTNVASGIFDSGPSAASSVATPALSGANGVTDAGVQVATAYQTASTFNAPLNGGGFTRMPDPYAWQTSASIAYKAASSAHKMDVSGPLWGAGTSPQLFGGTVGLTCTDCHDPHGQSNYRLLKASVNGVTVGGYDSSDVPTPFVFSNEIGYPVPTSVANPGGGVQTGSLPGGGWLKHEAGAAQMALYRPNYTKTDGTVLLSTEVLPQTRSMSVWCSACHTNYNQANAAVGVTYNYSPYLPGQGTAAQVGPKVAGYHRHAVDVTMAAGTGAGRALQEEVVQDAAWVPLENPGSGGGQWTDGVLGCLTCHRAHGSSVEMTGWASAHLETNTAGIYIPVRDGVPGVDPAKGTLSNPTGTSSLLRANNRGVCERCHNK
jgi:predicted CXXCH cytochrome family protein